jgi:hypothetical protein
MTELLREFPGEGRGPLGQPSAWIPAFAGKRFHMRRTDPRPPNSAAP